MVKKKGLLMLAAFLLMILAAVSLLLYANHTQNDLEEKIEIESEGVTKNTLSVKELTLHPSESKVYTVVLKSELEGDFDVKMDYRETKDGGMKPYVNVLIRAGAQVLYEGTLTDLLDKDHLITFDVSIHADDPLTLTICYSMPESIGNEAQDTFAEFDIQTTIARK